MTYIVNQALIKLLDRLNKMNLSYLFVLVIILEFLEARQVNKLKKKLPKSFSTRPTDPSYLSENPEVTKHIKMHTSQTSAYEDYFNDEFWKLQWYAQDYREMEGPVMDHNLVPVYKMNITGRGVRVGVIDDGVLKGVSDLQANHNLYYSVDASNGYGSGQPSQVSTHGRVSDGHMIYAHGTTSASIIAMMANNNLCGVGVAFNSEISGLKVTGRRFEPLDLAFALNYRMNRNHIFANTWDNPNDGVRMHRMTIDVKYALEKGAIQGRGGRGSIYMFPAGTGRVAQDNCAADEYVNNPYTLAIAGASQKGKVVASERCFGVIATAYSHGTKPIAIHEYEIEDETFVAATPGGCTKHFSGSATAVSLATGIIALTLEANRFLSYRDVMHLITQSAEVAPLAQNPDTWTKNAAGFWFSPDFGFGLLNAENMVLLARKWYPVPKEKVCEISKTYSPTRSTALAYNLSEEMEFDTSNCVGDIVTMLEQVELICSINFSFRGALAITLTSPQGTKSNILEPRPNDLSWRSLREWGLRSLQTWGEDPRGKWRVNVSAVVQKMGVMNIMFQILKQTTMCWKTPGTKQLTLRLRGTDEPPLPSMFRQPRTSYSAFRLPDGTTSHPLPAQNPALNC